jgi:hypothetical protein
MPTTFSKITSITLSSTSSAAIFSGIPATYDDLVLKISARSNDTSISDYPFIRFNNDSSSLYSNAYFLTNGNSLSRNWNDSVSGHYPPILNGNTASTNSFGSLELYLTGYKDPYHKVSTSSGSNQSINVEAHILGVETDTYRSDTAISTISIAPFFGSHWLTNSTFWLYGIKNS